MNFTMKRTLTMIALVAAMALSSESFSQNMDNWTRVYTSEGRSLLIPNKPKPWLTDEKRLDDGTLQFLCTNQAKQIYFAMFFYKKERSAADRMSNMVAVNNIDVKKSYTETYGNLTIFYKLGKMNVDGKSQNVLIATSEGAGDKFNVVGAFWSDQERFGKHKGKFPFFFKSLQ